MYLLTCMVLAASIFFSAGTNDLTEPKESVYTQEDIDLVARVVMSEASIEPFETKQAVAAVIFNRLKAGKYGKTIYEVIYSPNQFSLGYNGEPTEECYEAVQMAIDYPDCFPDDMLYFRTNYYFEKYNDYMNYGNTYFSTIKNYNDMEEFCYE